MCIRDSVSGAHSYQQIAVHTFFLQKCLDFAEGGEIVAFGTQKFQLPEQVSGGNVIDIFLAGSVNIRQHHDVRRGQSPGKILQKLSLIHI